MDEVWKPVVGWELYEVSTLGNVRNSKTGRLLKPSNSFSEEYLKYTLCVQYKRLHVRASRLVALTFIPNPSNLPEVDHINNDKRDNRVCNLRWATRGQNGYNKPIQKNNTTGYKGVSKHGSKYQVHIVKDGVQTHIGLFATKEEAHAAYCAAAVKHYGEFARFS